MNTNAEQFVDRILEIWNDQQKYKEMSVFAQEFARQRDIKPYINKLLDIYQGSNWWLFILKIGVIYHMSCAILRQNFT